MWTLLVEVLWPLHDSAKAMYVLATSSIWKLILKVGAQDQPCVYWVRTCFLSRFPGNSHAQYFGEACVDDYLKWKTSDWNPKAQEIEYTKLLWKSKAMGKLRSITEKGRYPLGRPCGCKVMGYLKLLDKVFLLTVYFQRMMYAHRRKINV